MVQAQSSYARSKADVLLVTVTEIEAQAVLDLFPGYEMCFLGLDETRPYYRLGVVSNTKIFMVQAVEMGIGGAGGALLTLDEALRAIAPTTVIMVGIAYGVAPDKQKIGDVLVSTKICDCNLERVSTDSDGKLDIRWRGNRIPAPSTLVSKFQVGAKTWISSSKIHFGPILSTEKLVDNLEYRNQLLRFEPEAIGGEMEGAALGTIEQRRGVDWILVKAICDWADGNKACEKDKRQEEAARNAARFTLHVIQQGGLAPSPHISIHRDTPRVNISRFPVAQGQLLRSYDGHAHWVLALSWEPRGNHIASTGGDSTVHVWNAETGQHLITYREHAHKGILSKTTWLSTIYNVAWSPDGSRIASSGDGNTVHVWNPDTGGTITMYSKHSGLLPNVFAIDWSPDSRRIASACSSTGTDKTAHIWDVKTGQTLLRYNPRLGLTPNFSVLALAWSPDGSRIAMTCADSTVRIWDAATGKPITSFQTLSPWTGDLAWSPDSTSLAIANPNGTVQLWDTTTVRLVLTYGGHTDSVRAVAWSPDGTTIASASNDNTVQLWDAASGDHIFTYKGHRDWATSVAWSPDGNRVASGSNDKTVQVWQAV